MKIELFIQSLNHPLFIQSKDFTNSEKCVCISIKLIFIWDWAQAQQAHHLL